MVDGLPAEFHSGTEEAQVFAVSEHAQVSAVSEEAQVSAVSWAAIVAGGVASAALTLLLLAFGAGMSMSAISPWSNSGVSPSTFNLGAFSIGGYLAGRLAPNGSVSTPMRRMAISPGPLPPSSAPQAAAQFALWLTPLCCSALSPQALLPPKEGAFATGPGSTRSRHSGTINPT